MRFRTLFCLYLILAMGPQKIPYGKVDYIPFQTRFYLEEFSIA